jgi:hypothetical protein
LSSRRVNVTQPHTAQHSLIKVTCHFAPKSFFFGRGYSPDPRKPDQDIAALLARLPFRIRIVESQAARLLPRHNIDRLTPSALQLTSPLPQLRPNPSQTPTFFPHHHHHCTGLADRRTPSQPRTRRTSRASPRSCAARSQSVRATSRWCSCSSSSRSRTTYIVLATFAYVADRPLRLLKARLATGTIRPLAEMGSTRVEMRRLNAGQRCVPSPPSPISTRTRS